MDFSIPLFFLENHIYSNKYKGGSIYYGRNNRFLIQSYWGGEYLYPITLTSAVYDLDGVLLSDILSSMNSNIEKKALKSHSHAISDITNLQSSLDSKASNSHTHIISDITNLQTTLDGKASSNHTHEYLPLSGGTITGPLFLGSDNYCIYNTDHNCVGLSTQNNINIRTWYGLSIDSTCGGQTTPSISFDARNGDMYLKGKIKPNHSDVHPNFNADMLDGYHASGFRKNNDGGVSTFNAMLTQGEYSAGVGPGNGSPVGGGIAYGKLLVFVSDGGTYNGSNNWIWQMFLQTEGDSVWIRSKTNNRPWVDWTLLSATGTRPTYVNSSSGPGGECLWAW